MGGQTQKISKVLELALVNRGIKHKEAAYLVYPDKIRNTLTRDYNNEIKITVIKEKSANKYSLIF